MLPSPSNLGVTPVLQEAAVCSPWLPDAAPRWSVPILGNTSQADSSENEFIWLVLPASLLGAEGTGTQKV